MEQLISATRDHRGPNRRRPTRWASAPSRIAAVITRARTKIVSIDGTANAVHAIHRRQLRTVIESTALRTARLPDCMHFYAVTATTELIISDKQVRRTTAKAGPAGAYEPAATAGALLIACWSVTTTLRAYCPRSAADPAVHPRVRPPGRPLPAACLPGDPAHAASPLWCQATDPTPPIPLTTDPPPPIPCCTVTVPDQTTGDHTNV